jgi:serine/threonine-protein kinase
VDASRERFRQIDQLFDAALDRPPNERDTFVAETCGVDHELRDRVRALLAAHDRPSHFMRSPAVELAAPLLEGPSGTATAAPEHAGPFRIVRELGHGGMGVVYLAEREGAEFRQRVALKLVRHLGAREAVRQRFVEERRILALLEHPHIAHLVDGGLTNEGLPYFAMELVEGEPIDAYCDAHQLTIERRLDLLMEVCGAVQYAHEHFVIHRDLKPSNILVRTDGQIKLLDFGIAKLLDPLANTNGDDPTQTGVVALSPQYAAPEQVRGQPVSAATDTYALGVLAYELLTGRRPYDVRGCTPAELERIVCELEPPRLSSTLGGPGSAGDDLARARARGTTPDRLRRRLKGDLDVIVAKALHKDPTRRYASAAALRDDLARWRSGHPVHARPDNAAYRLRKFVRRNPAGTALLVLLAAYAATVTIQGQRVRRALAEATLGAQRAEQVTDFMLGLFEESEAGERMTDTVSAGALLARGEARAAELSSQPAMQAQMLDVLGRLNMQVGKNDRAKTLLEQALGIRRQLYGESHPDYVTTLSNLADAVDPTDEPVQVVALHRQVLDARRRLSGEDDPKTIDAMWALAQAVHRSGDNKGAAPIFEQWLAAIARLPKRETPERAAQLSVAAGFLQQRGELDRAEPLLREALAIRRAVYGERHHLVAQSIQDLGYFYEGNHRHELAEPLLRQSIEMLRPIYPDGSPLLAEAVSTWAIVLEHMGRFADALPATREVLSLDRRFFGDSSLNVATAELNVSTALSGTGGYAEAESVARDAIAKMRARLGDKSAMVIVANVTLANALRGQGRFGEAEPLLLAAFKRFDPPKPITRNWHDAAAGGLVKLYEAQHRPEEAAKYRATITVPPR